MKWTPSKIAQLRELAFARFGAARIADHFGVSASAIRQKACEIGTSLVSPLSPEDALRRRWAVLIGPMKDQLRADIGSM